MDIRSFFGGGGLKKDNTKKQELKPKKISEEVKDKKDLDEKNEDHIKEHAKKNEKKEASKFVHDISDEEVDFNKSRKRNKSGKRKSVEGNSDADKKKKESLEKVKEPMTEEVKDKKNAKQKNKKRKVVEEDEDEMNITKKYGTSVLNSESEDEEPLPKSMRTTKKSKTSLNDSTASNSIAKAFTQVVPKTSGSKSTEAPKKKESRKLVNAIDFFTASPIEQKEDEKVNKHQMKKEEEKKIMKKVEKKEEKEEEKKEEKKEENKILKKEGSKLLKEERMSDKEEVQQKMEVDEIKMNEKKVKLEEEDEEDEVVETPVKSLSEKLALKKLKSTKMEGSKERIKKDEAQKEDVVKKNSKDCKKEEKVKKEEEKTTKKTPDEGVKEEVKKSKRKKPEENDEEEDEDVEETKKKKMKMAYAAFKQREPPKALGSREIPEGGDNCMEGLTFVLTGVYETVERDEVKGLIEKWGGKVTTSVSRNTDYLLSGRDPGMSKVDKAKQLRTKVIDEDKFFQLVTSLPAKKSKYEIEAETGVKVSKTPRSSKKNNNTTTSSSQPPPPSTSTLHATTPSKTSSTTSSTSIESLLWTDKYRPANMKQLIGQQGAKSPANKLLSWLQNWPVNSLLKPIFGKTNEDGVGCKAALLSGSPGVGKTTTAQVVCKELNFSFVELNASDTRSKRSLKEEVAECLNNQSLITLFGGVGEGGKEMKRHCLVMDEVDGMSGNEDRGGMQELIQLIKSTQIPIICLCNDRNHPKIRSLANHCFDLRFQRPRVEQIKSAIMTIAYKEHIKIPPSSLNDVITSANHDLRQILLNLSMWTVQQSSPSYDQLKKNSDNAKKDMHYSPFDVCRKVFSNDSEGRKMTLRDKSDLFFHDYNIASLFVQENYLSVSPFLARGDSKRHLALLSKAADAMCEGDVVDARIRKHQAWTLLPLQAIYASVLPGEYMKGGVGGMVQFPSWLGKNSTTNKNDRLLQELNLHTSISIKGNKKSLNQDYLPAFKHLLTNSLLLNDPLPTLDLMNAYDLLRDDLENIRELTNWGNAPDLFGKIDSKTKASLTRQFNKQSHLTPYSSSIFKKSAKKKMAEDGDEEEEDGDGGGDDDDDDPSVDAMIVKKSKKPTKAKQPAKEAPKKGKGATKDKKKK